MYKLKEKPEDFVVKERIRLDLDSEGQYGYYLLVKKEKNTLDAVKEVARFFNVSFKDVGYAGNKDKVAITKQYISVKRGTERNFKSKGLSWEFVGRGAKPISLGDLEGNVFEIVVRGVEQKRKVNFIENYYDEQRFGENNREIGKCFVKKDFKGACEILNLNLEDPLRSLSSLDKKMLSFYFHSYQSYLWNEIVARYIRERSKSSYSAPYEEGEFVFSEEKLKNIKVPLISFNSKFKDKLLNKFKVEVLKEEGIEVSDFLIKEFPSLATLPQDRDLIVDVEWNRLEFFGDRAKLKFFLRKGSYATLVVKKMFA
tara:strand:- start:245 stop:1183 length:939 start_codon:yes stop_codon:yes gene_type:complete